MLDRRSGRLRDDRAPRPQQPRLVSRQHHRRPPTCPSTTCSIARRSASSKTWRWLGAEPRARS
ncbi:hypothetical protein C7E25_22985, partial [Stenotrophomonas maltophilia]